MEIQTWLVISMALQTKLSSSAKEHLETFLYTLKTVFQHIGCIYKSYAKEVKPCNNPIIGAWTLRYPAPHL